MTGCNRGVVAVFLFGVWLSDGHAQYVGSQVCATCHAAIFSSYNKTAMGRSMVSGSDASLLDSLPAPFTIFDNAAGQYFEVARKPDGLYQSQYAVDRSGKEIFRQSFRLAYVVGSGENGFGFIVRRGDFLFEAPLTYYSKSRVWSFSPGYELRNLGFDRPVLAECIGCHSGRSMPVSDRAGLYRDPPFSELAVGCESCHGPGKMHAAAGGKSPIVNPARLSGWLSDNICMRCHQAGDVRVEQPGKEALNFRPGTPLNQVLSIFKVPINPGSEPQSVLLEHYFSMTLSKCFRASNGRLRCSSCHDPHAQPATPETASYYRARCLSCHQPSDCKLAADERARTKPGDNCVFCHMPRQTVTTITHAALTNHRVATRPEEPLPEQAFRANTDSGLIDLTRAPGDRAQPDPVTLLRAYASLIRDGHLEFKPKLDELLDRLSRGHSANPLVLAALARKAMAEDSPQADEQAIRLLKDAMRNNPTADNYILLASVYARRGRRPEAIQVLTDGAAASPYVKEFPESLAIQYMELGKYGDALRVIRKGLEVFPGDLVLRTLEKKAASATLDGSSAAQP